MQGFSRQDRSIDADLLIIGGGIAGCVAALKAVESGVENIVLWEKAGLLGSGSASIGIRNIRGVPPPEMTMDDVAETIAQGRDLTKDEVPRYKGIVDENIAHTGYRECWDTIRDMERWGIDFHWEKDSYRLVMDGRRQARTMLRFKGSRLKRKLALKVIHSPVALLERTMALDLLTRGNVVVGATGLNVRTGEFVVARAKAVLLSAGRTMRLYHPREGAPAGRFMMIYSQNPNPGDGTAMAFRAGAELVNMEIIYGGAGGFILTPHPYDRLCSHTGPLLGVDTRAPIVNARGERVGEGRADLDKLFQEEREGRGPCYVDATELPEEVHQRIENSKKDSGSITAHYVKERGFNTRTDQFELLPYKNDRIAHPLAGIRVDEQGRTSLNGLFAAGDNVGGTTYDGAGAAMVFGRKIGKEVNEFIRGRKYRVPKGDELGESRRKTYASLGVKDGVSPLEMELKIRDIVERYCGSYRSAGVISRGLWRLESLRENFFPQLRAVTPHDLMNVQDVTNLFLLAKVHLACAKEREESRPGNWRLDCPDQRDKPWKRSIIVRREGEGLFFTRRKMPSLRAG